MKKIYFIAIAVCALIYVIFEVRKKKFSIKESFYWVLAAIIMFFLAIFPYSIDKIAIFLNIEYPPSLLFVLCIIFLLVINFRNSKKIAEHQEKIVEMAQHIALLENELNKKGNK